MTKTNIYTHFSPEERPFIDQALDWIRRAGQAHEIKQTDFLDPRQQHILETLVNREHDVQVMFHGGYEDAERKRAWIAPDYVQLEQVDLSIEVLSIKSDDTNFAKLEHGDFMGAILGLGLKRDKIGDIHVLTDGCHCLAASETISYLNVQLRQVHRVHVMTDILPLEQLNVVEPELEEMTFTVSSLRLDALVSDAVRLSRSKAADRIRAGDCRLNWKVEIDPSKPVEEGDVISLRGFGRFKLIALGGKSKKDRLHVTIGKYI